MALVEAWSSERGGGREDMYIDAWPPGKERMGRQGARERGEQTWAAARGHDDAIIYHAMLQLIALRMLRMLLNAGTSLLGIRSRFTLPANVRHTREDGCVKDYSKHVRFRLSLYPYYQAARRASSMLFCVFKYAVWLGGQWRR